MRKINLLLLFICLMINVSCKKDSAPSTISVSTSSVSFSAEAGSDVLSITSNSDWSVSGSASWLSISPSTGSNNSSIVLKVEKNKDITPRNCTLTISTTDGEASASVTITQEAAEATMAVSATTIDFKATGGSQSLNITSNAPWNVTGGANWLTVNPTNSSGNGTITLTTDENKDFTSRDCTITIKTNDGESSQNVKVTQAATELTLKVDVKDLNFSEKEGDTQNLTITSNAGWKITGKPEWLDFSSTNGSGNSTIKLTTNSFNNSASERQAILFVTANGTSVEVKVTQKAGLVADCNVKLDDVVVLYDAVAFNMTYGSSVSYYYVGYLDKSDIGRMTEDEIIKVLDTNFERYTPSDSYVLSFPKLKSLHDYIIYTVAYDKNGKRGELVAKEIRTKSNTNQPLAYVNNVKHDPSYWYWDTEIGAYASKYYQWVLTGENTTDYWTKNDAIIAWSFAYLLKNYSDNFKPILQSDSWYCKRSGSERYIQIVTWGEDGSGNLSGLINNTKRYISNSASVGLQATNASYNKKETTSKKVIAVKINDLFDGVKIHRVK